MFLLDGEHAPVPPDLLHALLPAIERHGTPVIYRVRSNDGDNGADQPAPVSAATAPAQVYTVRRAHGDGAATLSDLAPSTVRGYTRWNAGGTAAPTAHWSLKASSRGPRPTRAVCTGSPRLARLRDRQVGWILRACLRRCA